MAGLSNLPDGGLNNAIQREKTDPDAGQDVPSNTPSENTLEGPVNPADTAVASQMCSHCLSSNKSRLPDNRDEWPIHKIDSSTYNNVCELLDLNLGKKPLVEALGCFSVMDVAKLQRKYGPTGGMGLSKEVLGKWGTSHSTHNVGKFKEILEKDMQRIDVLLEIKEWETFSVCHGCGIRLN